VVSYLVHSVLRTDMIRIVEKAAQAQQCYGPAILGVGWKKEDRLRRVTLTMDQLAAMARAGAQTGAILRVFGKRQASLVVLVN
jgi:hypothetical protein